MFNKDIGIDLGTVNILIYVKGQGIVLSEPSVVVVDEETKRPIAFGKEAFDMLGRTPGKIKVIKPMKNNENTKTTLSINIEEYRREEFLSKLEESKKQYKEGKVHSAKKVFKELREKYGY